MDLNEYQNLALRTMSDVKKIQIKA